MNHRRILASVGLAAALIAALALVACAPKPPADAPGIVGVVKSLVPGDDRPDSILVEGGAQGAGAVSDKAQVRIAPSTLVFSADGKPAPASSIVQGATVKVWFTGPVAESYPVQGSAKAVQVMSAP